MKEGTSDLLIVWRGIGVFGSVVSVIVWLVTKMFV